MSGTTILPTLDLDNNDDAQPRCTFLKIAGARLCIRTGHTFPDDDGTTVRMP